MTGEISSLQRSISAGATRELTNCLPDKIPDVFGRSIYFWVLCSIYLTSCCFCLATVVLMPFVAFGSGFVWLISVCLVTV